MRLQPSFQGGLQHLNELLFLQLCHGSERLVQERFKKLFVDLTQLFLVSCEPFIGEERVLRFLESFVRGHHQLIGDFHLLLDVLHQLLVVVGNLGREVLLADLEEPGGADQRRACAVHVAEKQELGDVLALAAMVAEAGVEQQVADEARLLFNVREDVLEALHDLVGRQHVLAVGVGQLL